MLKKKSNNQSKKAQKEHKRKLETLQVFSFLPTAQKTRERETTTCSHRFGGKLCFRRSVEQVPLIQESQHIFRQSGPKATREEQQNPRNRPDTKEAFYQRRRVCRLRDLSF